MPEFAFGRLWSVVYVGSLHHAQTLFFTSVQRLDYADKSQNKILLIGFLSLFVACFLSRFFLRRGKGAMRRTKSRLDDSAGQALCTVLTPTKVAWPLLYTSFFKKARVRGVKSNLSIELDLGEMLQYVCSGDLEIRDARDLGLMFERDLRIYGWDIGITLHPSWWFKTATWITQLYCVQGDASVRVTTQGLSYQWPLTCALRVVSRPRPSFDLDFMHYHGLGAEIRRIQSLHRRGNSTVIEFSCLGRGVWPMSLDFILCAVLFLPIDMHTGGRAARINRTSAPLFIKLESVIALLSSTGALPIKSIENISIEHTSMLYDLEQELVYNRDLRQEHIEDVGLEGWRKDRFMLAWEAGLLRAGKLARWRIRLCK